MSLHRYKAFGFNIESEIEIPELTVSDETPDVQITFGNVPDQLPNPNFSGVRFQASPDQFLLKVDNIATFHVIAGTTINIKRSPGSSDKDIRLFLLGSAFGALIHQRGLLPMHGSSIIINNKAFIFSGVSGAGKSTIAAGLIKRGYHLLSDDISVVHLQDSIPNVYAGYPGIKLWADSITKLGMDPKNYSRVREKLNKHHLEVNDNFYSGASQLGGVYILQTKNTEGIQMETIKGIEKFNTLKNNTYRINFIKGMGNNEAHFKHLSALAMKCPVKKITRSSKGFSLDELLDIIVRDIQSIHGTLGS